VSSIESVFGNKNAHTRPVHITSVKGNIGHAEAASGAAGLAKILLMLREGKIPAQAGLVNFNPRLSANMSPNMKITTEGVLWQSDAERPRIAMLNNFGAAGSNVAMLIQEFAPASGQNPIPRSAYAFSISAHSASALKHLCDSYIEMLKATSRPKAVWDICHTATARRRVYDFTISFVCTDIEDLLAKLQNPPHPRQMAPSKPLVLVFSGQGGVYLGMGEELLETSPVFRDSVLLCERLLENMGFPSIKGILDGSDSLKLDEKSTVLSQTACFVVQYSLAKLWLSWGVEPRIILGHR
jgi:acyl transferase domain-containing protein